MRHNRTAADNAFIMENNSTMRVWQMADALNLKDLAIYEFLKEQNLKPLSEVEREKKRLVITPEIEKYILSKYETTCLNHLSKALNTTDWEIGKFLKQRNLKPFYYYPGRQARSTGIAKETKEPEPQKFQRPPAVYSNPQWHELY